MDRLTLYRQVVRRIVEEAADRKPAYGEVEVYPLIDSDRDRYVAMQTGWVDDERIHGAFLHLDIVNGKVWIQFNGTDRDIAEELVEAGVSKQDIVVAEVPPEVRAHTGYAVG